MAAKANALFPQIAQDHTARAGRAVVPPKALSLPKPYYPLLDRVIERQGEVWVGFVVGPDGTVTDAKALSDSAPQMAKAAVEGVRRWKFTPGMVDGHAEEFLLTILVRFQLPRDSLKG
jgi:TonB family protein